MLKPSLFDITTERDGAGVRLTAEGELDLATSPQLENAIEGALDDGVSELIVDLSKLTFIDSSGLRLLISIHERSQSEDWRLSLVRPHGSVRTIFQVSGAEEHLPFASPAEPERPLVGDDGQAEADGTGQGAPLVEENAPFAEENAPFAGEGLS